MTSPAAYCSGWLFHVPFLFLRSVINRAFLEVRLAWGYAFKDTSDPSTPSINSNSSPLKNAASTSASLLSVRCGIDITYIFWNCMTKFVSRFPQTWTPGIEGRRTPRVAFCMSWRYFSSSSKEIGGIIRPRISGWGLDPMLTIFEFINEWVPSTILVPWDRIVQTNIKKNIAIPVRAGPFVRHLYLIS